jgi:predicted HicB family RNase H-like nuclease
MMKYKGYTATVEYDPSVNLLHGRVDNIQGVISFSASSTEDLEREFEASVDDYLALCEEHHLEPEKAYSGRLVLRLEPCVHRAIAIAAKHKNQSLNTWISCILKKELNWANGQLKRASESPS